MQMWFFCAYHENYGSNEISFLPVLALSMNNVVKQRHFSTEVPCAMAMYQFVHRHHHDITEEMELRPQEPA